IYTNQLNYFERLNQLHYLPKMEQLTKDYRSFMRGKNSTEQFYEDEETIAYVEPYGHNLEGGIVQLDISILDKVSDEEENFTVKVPLQESMHYVNITDVQLLNEKLYILTDYYGQSMEEEYYIYQIDVAERELEHNHSLNDVIGNGFWIANDYNTIGKETHYVFRKHEETQSGGTENEAFLSYHIETGEINQIAPPDDWMMGSDADESTVNPFTVGNYAIKEEFMYFIRFTEEAMVIDQYNLTENTLETTEELMFETETIEGLDLVFTEGDTTSLISTT